MNIRLITDQMPELMPMLDRSPGIHVSQVIHEICVRMGYYIPSTEPQRAMMELGCALEWAVVERLQRAYPDRYIQPGEFQTDGMFGTPDLLDTEIGSVDEIKLTWLSTKHGPESGKFWSKWSQIKAYCYMTGSSVGRLHICHVNGDYVRGPEGSGTVFHLWECEFSQDELEENWFVLMQQAMEMDQRGGVRQ